MHAEIEQLADTVWTTSQLHWYCTFKLCYLYLHYSITKLFDVVILHPLYQSLHAKYGDKADSELTRVLKRMQVIFMLIQSKFPIMEIRAFGPTDLDLAYPTLIKLNPGDRYNMIYVKFFS